MPIPIDAPRKKLRILLEKQLKLMETSNSPEARLLRQAIEGLVALNYGEAQAIYTPSDRKGSHDGSRPYTIKKLKMQALGLVDLLIDNGYKPAIHTVATAYGETDDAITGWRKHKGLGKTTDPLMKSFREKTANLAWDETHILEMLKGEGNRYRTQKNIAFKHKK
jgi:hypothetical protein